MRHETLVEPLTGHTGPATQGRTDREDVRQVLASKPGSDSYPGVTTYKVRWSCALARGCLCVPAPVEEKEGF